MLGVESSGRSPLHLLINLIGSNSLAIERSRIKLLIAPGLKLDSEKEKVNPLDQDQMRLGFGSLPYEFIIG